MEEKTFRNPKHIENNLKLFKILIETLDNHQIRYYLDFGTLIGAMRDNAFIPWDDDIDISLIDEKDYKKIPLILKEINKKYSYRTYLHTFKSALNKHKKKHLHEISPQIDFTNKDNYQIAKIRNNKFWIFGRGAVCIDIFFKYHKNNNLYWFAYGKVNEISDQPLKKEFSKINFYGISCTIPTAYDAYLTSIYGEWKTPHESWTETDQVNK